MRRFLLWLLVLPLMGAASVPFKLTSPVFNAGRPIPARFTCDGANMSPPLAWHDAPAGTKSFALVMQDPDAPGGLFHHWGIYNIPAGADHLGEAFPAEGSYRQAHNDMGGVSYGGPCPPPGDGPHRYQFILYALDVATLNLADHTKVEAIGKAVQPHLLGIAETMGTYQR